MSTLNRCGCFFTLPSGREISLPLQAVDADVQIADVLARVTLTQHFANTNRTDIPGQAEYVFPVPVGGAVCGFEMHTADGKTIVGKVKEALQAQAEFKEAVADNRTAGLLAKAAPDVFTVALGAIPPRQAIKTIVTYVIELVDDELSNQVRFSLPTYIGLRYGRTPTAALAQVTPTRHARFTLTAEVQTTSPLERVTSSSHTIKTSLRGDCGPVSGCSVVLDSAAGAILDKDFILSIKAGKLDTARCVAEIMPTQNSVALSLTLVPRFGVQQIASQEYIFLIDRSGSMNHQCKMEYAKKALHIMLKSLPTVGAMFNIFSFGSSHSSLWPASQPYSQNSLAAAVLYVDSMGADMGGTEIGFALHSVLGSRTTLVPTSVFVLTDGEVWQIDPLLASLRASVAAAGNGASSSYLRIFTLGIGHSASSALCSGLARTGNGLCLMSTQGEELAGKCARLLRASRVPPSGNLQNVRVDWGHAGSEACSGSVGGGQQPNMMPQIATSALPAAATTFFDDEHDDPDGPTEGTGVQANPMQLAADVLQAPSVVPDFYPGNRLIVSAILQRTTRAPESVVLRGEAPDGAPIELRVPVHAVDFPGTRTPLVHTLAAHRLIQELEGGYVQCLGLTAEATVEGNKAIARGAAVFFSVRYQLASKYASFIAVEEKEERDEAAADFMVIDESDIGADEWVDDFEVDEKKPETVTRATDRGSSAHAYVPTYTSFTRAQHEAKRKVESQSSHEIESYGRVGMGGAMGCALPHRGRGGVKLFAGTPAAAPRPASFRLRQSQQNFAQISENTVPGPLRLQSYSAIRGGALPGIFHSPGPRALHKPSIDAPDTTLLDDPVTAIARLQAFDGSFELNDALRKLVFGDKVTLDDLRNGISASVLSHAEAEKIWATAIAVAYLKTKAGETMDVWVGLWEKASSYAAQALAGSAVTFDQFVSDAVRVLFKL